MVNQLSEKKEFNVLELLSKKESQVLDLLKLMLEDELRFVDLNVVKVAEVFCKETYYLSGFTHEWNLAEGRWMYSYCYFVVAFGDNCTVYNLASNRVEFTSSRKTLIDLLMTEG